MIRLIARLVRATLRLLLYPARVVFRRMRFLVCRIRLSRSDVIIQRDAALYGFAGIKLGKGTRIYRGAILAATILSPYDAFESKPDGRIELGERCCVLPGAIIASYRGQVIIGDDVNVNPGVIIYGHGGVYIGSKTRIAAQTVIIPANHIYADPCMPIMVQGETTKGIKIGHDVWIGTGVRILDGVTIGDGAVVGAGSVVVKDIPPYTVNVGVPTRVIRNRGDGTA